MDAHVIQDSSKSLVKNRLETLRDAENQIDKIHSISAIETVNISISSIEMANVNNNNMNQNSFITKPLELFILFLI